MKKAIILVLVAFLVGCYPAWAGVLTDTNQAVAQTKTIRCGYVLYPPYMEKDVKTGRLGGAAYDVAEALAATLKMKIEWVREIPIGAELADLEKGGIDSVCAVTGPYDVNLFPYLAFSDPIFVVRNKIYARVDDVRFKGTISLADLNKADVRFSGIDGDTTFIFPHMLTPKATMVSLPALSETAQLFQNLKYKKADVVMVEAAPAAMALKANPGLFRVVDVEETLPSYALALAFLKKDIAFRDTVNEAIRFMKLNNQIEPILIKYDTKGDVLVRIK